jgi:hypothetical protein
MIVLDSADLAVIAARTLGIGTDAALAVMDIPAAQAALAEAQPPVTKPSVALSDRDAAAAASVGLVHALLRYRPFPRHGRQVAVTAGLQFLSLNGWQADLTPPATAAVVIDALASGQLAAGDAAAWLSQRLSPTSRAHRAPRLRRAGRAPAAARRPGRGLRRPLRAPAIKAVASALATAMVGGAAILATACSSAPDMSPATPHHAVQTSQVTTPAPTGDLLHSGHPHPATRAAVIARR